MYKSGALKWVVLCKNKNRVRHDVYSFSFGEQPTLCRTRRKSHKSMRKR